MKKINLALSAIGLMIFSSATSQNVTAGIEFEDMNVAYMGINNPARIVSIYKIDSITFNSNKGQINDLQQSKDSKSITCNLTFTSCTPKGQEIELNIWRNGNAAETKKIRVRRIPDPYLYFMDFVGGSVIDKSDIKALISKDQSITAKFPAGFDYDVECKVNAWDLQILNKKNVISSFKGSGPNLSKDAKDAISKSEVDTKIIIEVKLQFPDGTSRMAYATYTINDKFKK